MNRNLATSVALIAATILVPTTSAMAQNRDAEIRFESAQRRFDGELAMFKAEVERYERVRLAAGQPTALPVPQPSVAAAPVLAPVPAEAPRVVIDDARDMEDGPRAAAPAPSDPADRDEPADRPL